jgi:hypothetical protein
MVIAAGREEGSLRPVASDDFEAHQVAIKGDGSLKVGDLQVDVADVRSGWGGLLGRGDVCHV